MQQQTSSVNGNDPDQSDIQQESIHSVQNLQQSPSNSPQNLTYKRNTSRIVKISSMSSLNSRAQLIKVSKNQQSAIKKLQTKQGQSVTQKQGKKDCRICLQDQSQGRIIKPCKCTGTMQHVHQTCLCEWIKRKIDFKSRYKVRCQVCDQPFDYKIAKRLSLNCDYLKANYQRFKPTYRCFILIMSILLIIWLSLLILFAIGMSQSDQGVIKKNLLSVEQTKIIFMCVIFIYLLVMGFVSLLFVAEYGVKTQLIVKNAQNYCNKKNKKIVPRIYTILT